MRLSSDERRVLLELARRAIREALNGAGLDFTALEDHLPFDSLRQPAAVFVTLRRGGVLRGCVGVLQPRQPLYRAVVNAAVLSATQDPRFAPVSVEELSSLEIEVSLLSPFFTLTGDQVVPGQHGLVVSDGVRRGLLLPQVATEQNWTREQLLEQACLKADLPPTAWREGVHLEGFTAFVFSDAGVVLSPVSPARR